jgi:hypothetical protein
MLSTHNDIMLTVFSLGGFDVNYFRQLAHASFDYPATREDLMYPVRSGSCTRTLSAQEREYAGYLYSRPVGNTDPDDDPGNIAFALPTIRVQ